MFDYKQRPFGKAVTDEIYDRAVGRAPSLVSASASGSLTSPLVMPNEQPCAETGCYWDQLPVPQHLIPDVKREFKRHIEPCPLAARDYLCTKD